MKRARTSADTLYWLRPTASGRERVRQLHEKLTARPLNCRNFARLATVMGVAETPALDRAVRLYAKSHEEGMVRFVERVLRPSVKCALEFDALFSFSSAASAGSPPKTLVELNPRAMTLSRRQLFCIVANAFFCTFAAREADEDCELPSIDYEAIHTAPADDCNVEVVKLRMLFDYFARVGAIPRSASVEPDVAVHRTCYAAGLKAIPAARLKERMTPPVVHALRESIDDQHDMLRVDFANRWIGGGALSDGCVQEEITFAQCPELNALRWLHGPMLDDEAIVVRGYYQYAQVEKGSYGFSIRYGGPLSRTRRPGGALVAVDALDYRYLSPEMQYTAEAIERELVKLISAFSIEAVGDVKEVAGGNWGCGVFGGDAELKFLIQWLACALCSKTLHYFPFDNPSFAVYATAMRQLCHDGLTTGDLLQFLTQLEPTEDGEGYVGSVFSDLLLSRGDNA